MSDKVRRRFALAISYLSTLFILVTLNFFLPRAMPGDPVSTIIETSDSKTNLDASTRAKVARYYGLEKPIYRQYVQYVGGLVTGDLGTSMRYRTPVRDVLAQRLPWSILLGLSALLISVILGSVAGIHAGWRLGRPLDQGLTALFTGIRVFPTFFLASVILFGFSVKLGWFPLGGADTAFSQFQGFRRLADVVHHLALPASIMGVQIASFQYLLMRSSMVSEAGADYLKLARAKGLSERRLKYAHAARNALLPAVTQLGGQVAFVVTGSIFVETVFAYPGIGRLLFDAVGSRDYPVLQACFLTVTLAVLSVNFCLEVVYPKLDPRVVAA